jgi:integrase/recombinase XerD
MTWSPRLMRTMHGSELHSITLGLRVVDDYLQLVGARCRPNTWLATAYGLLVFFSVLPQQPAGVTTADVFAFLQRQRAPRRDPKLVRLEDGEAGLAVRTIKRRLVQLGGKGPGLIRAPANVRHPDLTGMDDGHAETSESGAE